MTVDASDYARAGYARVHGLLRPTEVEAIRHKAALICRGGRGQVEGLLPTDDTASDDDLTARYLCLHFPHKLSPLLMDVMRHPRIVEVLCALIGPDVKCMQSMLFIKHAGKPGQSWHQDENFIPTRDRSLTAAWIALDDADTTNGCLWAHPESHRSGILWPDARHADPRFDSVPQAQGFPYDPEGGIALPARAGDVIFFNGYLLHRSLPNTSSGRFRRALVFHYMSATSLLPWDWAGRTAPTRDNRDIVLVTGRDPYAHKGIASITYPFLRSEHGALSAGGRAGA